MTVQPLGTETIRLCESCERDTAAFVVIDTDPESPDLFEVCYQCADLATECAA